MEINTMGLQRAGREKDQGMRGGGSNKEVVGGRERERPYRERYGSDVAYKNRYGWYFGLQT